MMSDYSERSGITDETVPNLVIPPFKPGAGFAQAGIHALDSRLRGNDDGVESSSI